MISSRLKNLFLIGILLFIAHGMEEYFTGFLSGNGDPIFNFIFRPFEGMSPEEATFVMFQLMFWSSLIMIFLLLSGKKWALTVLVLPGIIYVVEAHHLIEAAIHRAYYPGMVTALFFPVLAFFYWKELLKQLRS